MNTNVTASLVSNYGPSLINCMIASSLFISPLLHQVTRLLSLSTHYQLLHHQHQHNNVHSTTKVSPFNTNTNTKTTIKQSSSTSYITPFTQHIATIFWPQKLLSIPNTETPIHSKQPNSHPSTVLPSFTTSASHSNTKTFKTSSYASSSITTL